MRKPRQEKIMTDQATGRSSCKASPGNQPSGSPPWELEGPSLWPSHLSAVLPEGCYILSHLAINFLKRTLIFFSILPIFSLKMGTAFHYLDCVCVCNIDYNEIFLPYNKSTLVFPSCHPYHLNGSESHPYNPLRERNNFPLPFFASFPALGSSLRLEHLKFGYSF